MKASGKLLLVLYFSFIAAGIVEGITPLEAEWPLAFIMVHGLLVTILLFAWCGTHAQEHRILYPTGSRILTAFVPPLGLTYYLLAGFGIRNGSKRLMKALLFFAICQLSYNSIFYALQDAG